MLPLDSFIVLSRQIIVIIGVCVIAEGALYATYQLLKLILTKKSYGLNQIRLQFGNSITLGLEFLVGADIIGSVIHPDYYNVGILVILVIIRIILSYFLNKELRALSHEK